MPILHRALLCPFHTARVEERAKGEEKTRVKYDVLERITAALGISAAAITGAAQAPAWADAEHVNFAAVFDSDGALDASSLGGVHTGVAPAPGLATEETVRGKRPNSTEADPLKAKRSGDPRPAEPGLVGYTPPPVTAAPISQPAQTPPAATNTPPATNNTPATNGLESTADQQQSAGDNVNSVARRLHHKQRPERHVLHHRWNT